MKSISIVCVISFLASIACYFLAAIIPWEILPTRDVSFTIGVMVGSVLLLVIAGVCHASRNKIDVFKMFPILLVIIVVAFALELADQTLYFPSFILALGVSSILEITLIMYFGILTSKGYVAPALAFCAFRRLHPPRHRHRQRIGARLRGQPCVRRRLDA